jgi:single-strand DNA-binding protein
MGSPSTASCQILGNLTKEPDFRRTASGSPVCELTVAVNHRGSNGQDEASFIEVVVWGKTAENCRQYLSKGSSVFIEGYLKQERWQDRNSGANRSKLRVAAEKVLFLANRREQQQPQEQYQYVPEQQPQQTTAKQNLGVDPAYTPEPYKPRFYGDTGSVSKPVTPDEPVQDDIPF